MTEMQPSKLNSSVLKQPAKKEGSGAGFKPISLVPIPIPFQPAVAGPSKTPQEKQHYVTNKIQSKLPKPKLKSENVENKKLIHGSAIETNRETKPARSKTTGTGTDQAACTPTLVATATVTEITALSIQSQNLTASVQVQTSLDWVQVDYNENSESKTKGRRSLIKAMNVNICCKNKHATLLDCCFAIGFVQIGMGVLTFVFKLITTVGYFYQTEEYQVSPRFIGDLWAVFEIPHSTHFLEGVTYFLFACSGLLLTLGASCCQKWLIVLHLLGSWISGCLMVLVIIMISMEDRANEALYKSQRHQVQGPIWYTTLVVLIVSNAIFLTYSCILFFRVDQLGQMDADNLYDDVTPQSSVIRCSSHKQRKMKMRKYWRESEVNLTTTSHQICNRFGETMEEDGAEEDERFTATVAAIAKADKSVSTTSSLGGENEDEQGQVMFGGKPRRIRSIKLLIERFNLILRNTDKFPKKQGGAFHHA